MDHTTPPLDGQKHAMASDQQAQAILARAKQDPFMAEALLRLQKEAFEQLENIIRETSNALPMPAPGPAKDSAPAQMNTITALRGQSRQRETAGRQKRELAEAMVIGALINRDNPDWDAFDPSTSRQSGENLILALLQMELPDAGKPGQ